VTRSAVDTLLRSPRFHRLCHAARAALWRALGVEDLDGAMTRLGALLSACGLESRLGGLGVGTGDSSSE
jgi:hypothetical protein